MKLSNPLPPGVTIRPFEYRNPETILIAREEKTCKGCVWQAGKISLGERALCAKDKLIGKRCKEYQPSEAWTAYYRSRTARAQPPE